MRIISVTQNSTMLRVVAEIDGGRLREMVMGEDEDGDTFIRWGDVETEQEPEFETFNIHHGGSPTSTVSWFNIPLEEAVRWDLSGKWEIQMRDSPLDEWVPFSKYGPVYDAMQFRARPKPGELL